MHWHILPGRTIATNDGGIGNGRLRIPYSGRGTYNFNIEYNPHTQNKCPVFANVSVQGFNPAGKAATTPQKPALLQVLTGSEESFDAMTCSYDAEHGGVCATQSSGRFSFRGIRRLLGGEFLDHAG